MAATCIKQTFQDQSGYLFLPTAGREREMIALGHTAFVAPWSDPALHRHTDSWEYYILWHGRLHFLVANLTLTLRAPEILVVKPGIPHAIVGGEGPIEHVGIRAPGLPDKQVVAELPTPLPPFCHEDERELRAEWGYRIPLQDGRYQNWWVLGLHKAHFTSPPLALAYLNLPTAEAAAINPAHHQLHSHTASWEYYLVWHGSKRLRLEDEEVTVNAGEILEVPPGVAHCVIGRTAPLHALTLRAPVLPDKVIEVRNEK
jgi:mannose-6-phosphate isomerase-like protein (cupin superfamily)